MSLLYSLKPQKPASSLKFSTYPTLRDHPRHTGELWLKGKRQDDNAEGLWRVHDKLYDFSDFIAMHPGGRAWLQLTKGTDITEAFEAHHISTYPETLLANYFVREASAKRNSPFTFKEDGFYRTLKSRVRPLMKDLPDGPARVSERIADCLFAAYIFTAFSAAFFHSFALALTSGIFLSLTAISAHNFFHRKDNFRMYYFDFSMLSSRDWRTTHALSHHIYTNTVYDYEISFVEPFFQYLPVRKHFLWRYFSWIYGPFIYVTSFVAFYIRMLLQVLEDGWHTFRPEALLPFTVPLFMYLSTDRTLLQTSFLFAAIIVAGSAHFSAVGINAAHHHPDIFHDGDAPRREEDLDWGLHQLDAVGDRSDINWSQFLVLTNFGQHCLHHFFPTLDHGHLPYLLPVVMETCKDFGVNMLVTTQWDLVKGQYRQLARTQPTTNTK